ncbi:response regulator transcription factor [Streptomyces sp. HU2014]|uniref:LuxR family transcriptional regulator n=1 Tax=Streptomyces albireticuli TaxID=1940 RepID=A0A1Z2LDB2_9ACTN|nr:MULTISPECIES: response regulator transcription factor [Streptomyces]ARZ72299.1 LuxR family transcriptional regulator [Streptomyces albireticuli]UQI45661.1 response regulator transcription factor [Streptomyces sp. HU2014]
MIRVLIADDDALVRAGIRALVEASPQITVTGEARDGLDALDQAGHCRPDVVLMDIEMPGCDGLAATRRLLERPDPPKVLVLTTFGMDENITAALHAGASGFLLKQLNPEQLIHAVCTVAAGGTVLSPTVTRQLLSRGTPVPRRTAEARALVARLSAREREVFACLGEGMSNAGIAEKLYMSPSTVKTYVSRALTKLDVDNRTQAALLAYELNLCETGGNP